MKDILIRHKNMYVECEIDNSKLTYTHSETPNSHTVVIFQKPGLYRHLKNEIQEIYDTYTNKDEGYDVACEFLETVDCHNKYFVDGSAYVYHDVRSREEIENYLDEADDKVWLMRNCHIPSRRPLHGAGRLNVDRILSKYNDIPKRGYDDWDCGYWNGIMGALRWVLGDNKDFLDT